MSHTVIYRYWGFTNDACYDESDIFRDVHAWHGCVRMAHPYYEFEIPSHSHCLLQLKYPHINRNGFFMD